MKKLLAYSLVLSTLSCVGTMCFSMNISMEQQNLFSDIMSPKYDLDNIKKFCSDYTFSIYNQSHLDAFNIMWDACRDLYPFLLDNNFLSVLYESYSALIKLISHDYNNSVAEEILISQATVVVHSLEIILK